MFYNRPVFAPNKRHRAGDWKMLGRTDAGRPLAVVVHLDETRLALRAVTGWNATKGEMSRYFNRGES